MSCNSGMTAIYNHGLQPCSVWRSGTLKSAFAMLVSIAPTTEMASCMWGAHALPKLPRSHIISSRLPCSPTRCQMFVPGFGEKSPERKAADSLHNFFTFVAVKIVMSQLQDYNKEGYEELSSFVDRVSLKDGDQFCAALLRESPRHKGLALRIMEVRSAYARQDFEWDNLQALAMKQVDEANVNLMREFVVETTSFQDQ